jgi:hypothetical protein
MFEPFIGHHLTQGIKLHTTCFGFLQHVFPTSKQFNNFFALLPMPYLMRQDNNTLDHKTGYKNKTECPICLEQNGLCS